MNDDSSQSRRRRWTSNSWPTSTASWTPRAAAASRNCWPPMPKSAAACKQMERTWDLLDDLDAAPAGSQFTQTHAGNGGRGGPRGRPAEPGRGPAPPPPSLAGDRRRLCWRPLAAGFLAVVAAVPDPNRQLLEDLPVLENLDQYRQIDDIEFLQTAPRRRAVSTRPARRRTRRRRRRTNRWPSGGSASRA